MSRAAWKVGLWFAGRALLRDMRRGAISLDEATEIEVFVKASILQDAKKRLRFAVAPFWSDAHFAPQSPYTTTPCSKHEP